MRIITFLQYTSYYSPKDKNDSTTVLLTLFFFSIPFIFTLIFIIKNRVLLKRKDVIFDENLPFNRDNLLEAYILLSAQILKSDRGFSKEKLQYMHKYFKRHFPKNYYNFRETLSEAYKNPIKINSITSWIRAFMRSKRERTQIIYFLAGICIIDGRFSALEIKRLEEIALKIRLTTKEFNSILAMYKSNNSSYQDAKSERNKTRQKTYSQSSGNSKSSNKSYSSRKNRSTLRPESKKSINCKIIGVPINATMPEIKKAYRKLVKIHHPDRFHNDSEEQQAIAKAKFIKIQQAYEYLEMIMK